LLVGLKQYYFLDNSGELKTSIQLQGDFVIAYALRLWKSSDDKVVNLIEDIRGSCFNKTFKTICYNLLKLDSNNFTYFLELDANISTIQPKAEYAIKLSIEQKIDEGEWRFLATEKAYGNVSCNERGVFSNIGITFSSNNVSKMIG